MPVEHVERVGGGSNIPLALWIQGHFPQGFRGYAMDIGASDGFNVSTTYYLEKDLGWNVLCVEPNPRYADKLNDCRRFVRILACGERPSDEATFHINTDNPEAFSALRRTNHPEWHAAPYAVWDQIKVKVRTVDQLMEQQGWPSLDALCVDTEGTELDVLKGANLAKWKPKCLVVENWDAGSTDEYLKPFGYKRVARSMHNDLLVLNA
jgi:FkbM family methyltransferase